MKSASWHYAATLVAESVSAQMSFVQVTTDYLDRLRQMKARMTGIKTRVETVRSAITCLDHTMLLMSERRRWKSQTS